jgi:hypothetical protein
LLRLSMVMLIFVSSNEAIAFCIRLRFCTNLPFFTLLGMVIFFIVIIFESKAGLEPAIIPIDTCFFVVLIT